MENVSVKLQQKMILNNLSLCIGESKLVMALGLNGVGKTTLLKTLAGLICPVCGKISYNDIPINQLSFKQRAKLISYIPQEPEAIFRISAEEFVRMGLTPHMGFFELPGRESNQKVFLALKKVGIEGLIHKFMDEMSGGERKLVYLARTIVQNSEFLLLDEPTAFLDFKRQHEFLTVLKKHLYHEGKCALLSVHDPNLALRYADCVLLFHQQGTIETLYKTENKFYNRYLDSLNSIYGGRLEYFEKNDVRTINWKGEETCSQRKTI